MGMGTPRGWDRFVPTSRVLPTGDILRGRTSVGVYFCADWCGPCKAFTPILTNYYTGQRASSARDEESTLESVLVSRCRTARESEALFLTMPWTAMPHLDSVGTRRDDLMAKFRVTTIPALVFLEGTGAITCQDGRSEVVRQQAAANRTEGASDQRRRQANITSATTARPKSRLRLPAGAIVAYGVRPQARPAPGASASNGSVKALVLNCDLPARARGGLPPDTGNASHQAPRSPGSPPTFLTTARASVLAPRRLPAQQEAAGRPQSATTPIQEVASASPAPTPRPPWRSDRKRPPPKPNLVSESKQSKVWFAEGTAISPKPVQSRQQPDSRTAYHLTVAQLALMAKAALGGGGSATRETSMPAPQYQHETARVDTDWIGTTHRVGPIDPLKALGAGPNPAMGEVQRLRNAAWQAIETATVDGSERKRWWKAWKEHNTSCYIGGDSYPANATTDKLLTFAVAVWEDQYGLGSQVKVQLVKRALRHVAQKFVLDGHPDPRRSSPAQQSLDLPIARLIKNYQDADPPPQPKLALPVSTITALAINYRYGGPCHHRILLPAQGWRIHVPGKPMRQTEHSDPQLRRPFMAARGDSPTLSNASNTPHSG